MVWPLALASIAGAGATLGSAVLQSRAASSAQKGQEEANAKNFAFAREQMAWQRENYQKRHQWEVDDLREAGLNPILSAMGNVGSVGSPVGAKAESKTKQSSIIKQQMALLAIQSAKAMAETGLLKEKQRTEVTQQEKNRGNVGIPGFINTTIDRLQRGGSSAKSKVTRHTRKRVPYRNGPQPNFVLGDWLSQYQITKRS